MSKDEEDKAGRAITTVIEEYGRAISLHGSFASAHEGLAVVEEEFLELRSEVFWGRKGRTDEEWCKRMEKEATQLAAMALRFVAEIPDRYKKEEQGCRASAPPRRPEARDQPSRRGGRG